MSTIELYARYTVQFLNYSCKDFHAITYIDVDAFIKSLQIEGAKPATVNTVNATLKSFYKTMVDARFIESNPTAFLKKAKKQREQVLAGHLQHSFSAEEMETLLAYMQIHAPQRDYVLMMFLYTTGLRAIEACSLTWDAIIQWQNQWYVDVVGKGSKARRVYIPEKTFTLLMNYRQSTLQQRPKTSIKSRLAEPIFPNQRKIHAHLSRHGMYKIIKRWIFEALGKDASPHWMRHTCFTQQRLLGATLESIQAGAGHASIETTMQYNEAAALMDPAGKVFDG
ncbi:MAG: tyrosine-type recombinase/integrase [Pseudomonadota bacterium]